MDKRTLVFIAAMIGLIGGGLLYRHSAQEVDPRGATRLMRAIEENDAEKAEKLLSAEEVNARDKSGQTALFYAARHATDPKVIYKLIVAGADPFTTDKSGNTALVVAAQYNPSVPVVMALAKQKNKQTSQQLNKNHALVQAAKHNTAEVIKALLIAQASPAPVHPGQKEAAAFLAENESLTEQEKNAYRQVMLTLEILEAREKFNKSTSGGPASSKQAIKSSPKTKSEVKAKPEQTAQPIKDVNAKVSAPTNGELVLPVPANPSSSPLPQEKKMSDNLN